MGKERTLADDQKYYGAYCRLDNTNADSSIMFDGNTAVIGTELAFAHQVHVTQRGKEVSRMVLSCGDQEMGFLPSREYKKIVELQEKGWTCRAFLSLVVYNKPEETFWGEVALVCYGKDHEDEFGAFCDNLVKRICKGEHPDIDLSSEDTTRVIETKGQWADMKEKKRPKPEAGSAYFKTRRSFAENMAYAAAEGNKGCYAGLFIVVFIIIFSIIWFIFFR